MRETTSIEKEIAKAEETGQTLEKLDQNLDSIAEKDKALYEFVETQSEGLEPNAKELIKIYTDISRITQREFYTENDLDKELLIQRAKTFKDMAAQIFEKLRPYVKALKGGNAKKFENFENMLFDFSKQAESTAKDAEKIDDSNPKSEKEIDDLNREIISVLGKMRLLTNDLYIENLYGDDDPSHNNLPNEITKKITILAEEK